MAAICAGSSGLSVRQEGSPLMQLQPSGSGSFRARPCAAAALSARSVCRRAGTTAVLPPPTAGGLPPAATYPGAPPGGAVIAEPLPPAGGEAGVVGAVPAAPALLPGRSAGPTSSAAGRSPRAAILLPALHDPHQLDRRLPRLDPRLRRPRPEVDLGLEPVGSQVVLAGRAASRWRRSLPPAAPASTARSPAAARSASTASALRPSGGLPPDFAT